MPAPGLRACVSKQLGPLTQPVTAGQVETRRPLYQSGLAEGTQADSWSGVPSRAKLISSFQILPPVVVKQVNPALAVARNVFTVLVLPPAPRMSSAQRPASSFLCKYMNVLQMSPVLARQLFNADTFNRLSKERSLPFQPP